MTTEEMNMELERVCLEWDEIRLIEYFKKDNSSPNFSLPFASYCPDLKKDAPVLMLIGKEPRDWILSDSQKETIESPSSMTENAYKIMHPCPNAPFWRLFRIMEQNGFSVVWSNVDKVHRLNSPQKTIPLTLDDEEFLSGKYAVANCTEKTLLQREIEIVHPDAILFVTGPDYFKTMSLALGLSESHLRPMRPVFKKHSYDTSKVCRPCDLSNQGVFENIFWCYHPSYLVRRSHCLSGESFESFVGGIAQQIKKSLKT